MTERKRRIVHISSYYPPHMGGQENAVQDMAKQLAAAGHDVWVLTSTEGGGPRGMRIEDGVKVIRLRGLVFGHAPIMPGFVPTLCRVARQNSVVHVHIGQAFTPEMVWLASKLRRFKYIAELHIDFEPSGSAGVFLPLYKRLVLGPALRAAATVAVLNDKTLQLVRTNYKVIRPALIVSNGIAEAYFKIERPAFKSQPPKNLHLLFVGRLARQKNLPTLIEAIASSKRPVSLDIIGDGDDRDTIISLIKRHRLKNVTLHGRLPRSQVLHFYATCDALVMPSLYEAQPLVLLEAMAAGIPIIGTNVIGVAEHLKGIGIIVEPSPQSLANAFEQFDKLYLEKLPRMVAAGRAKADKLRWEHVQKDYEVLYEDIAKV